MSDQISDLWDRLRPILAPTYGEMQECFEADRVVGVAPTALLCGAAAALCIGLSEDEFVAAARKIYQDMELALRRSKLFTGTMMFDFDANANGDQ